MTATTNLPAVTPQRQSPPPRRRRGGRLSWRETAGGWLLTGPYILVFLVAAAIPIVFAIWKALQKPSTILRPGTGFGGLSSFKSAISDYRFWGTFENIGIVMLIWLPIMLIGVIGLALLVHASPGRFGSSMRFIYYIPGALSGIANFMLWVYLINPSISPIAFLWNALDEPTIKDATHPFNIPFILAAMLFFQGLGTWVVIVNGGLNGIPEEIFEAGSLDGANAWKIAWHIKLPMIRPWIGYAALMNIAYGFQLFMEPYLLHQVSSGAMDSEWAPAQLTFAFAFTNRNLPAAAAMSIILLLVTLVVGLLTVFRSGLFGEEERR